MLLRPDATYINDVTKRAERVFPAGSQWHHFESRLPDKSVFENSVLDPAIGIAGALSLKTFATADFGNWLSSTQIGLFELGTRIGLPPLVGNTQLTTAVSQVFNSVSSSLDTFQRFDTPEEIVQELLTSTGIQIIQKLGQGNMVAQTVAQVIAAATWAAGVIADAKRAELAKDVPLPPLQTEDPTTDTWQVNRVFEVFRQRGTGGVVYPDGGVEPASNADYTSFFLPAYRFNDPWKIQHRAQGVAAQQGMGRKARSPLGTTNYTFNPGDVSTFGFMPGTTTTLRVLQASYRFYKTPRGTDVDRYTLRCRGINKPCYKSPKAFDGSRDCRQCVKAESVWPTEGLGWAYGGAALNATTPGTNVGAFYPSTNKLLLNILEMAAKPGPLLFTINMDVVERQWRLCFERFWSFARQEWGRHHGPGWRGQISRLATLMTAFGQDDSLQPGGRNVAMPVQLIASPRTDSKFDIPFSDSIYSRIILPFCTTFARMQNHYLQTTEVAYIPPGAGALYSPSGKIRTNWLGRRFLESRRELLASNKRVLVDLRRVSDPEFRDELERAGVKLSKVNPRLQGSPGLGHELLRPTLKPARAPTRPKTTRATPFDDVFGSLRARRLTPKRAPTTTSTQTQRRKAVAVSIGGGLVVAAGVARIWRVEDDRD